MPGIRIPRKCIKAWHSSTRLFVIPAYHYREMGEAELRELTQEQRDSASDKEEQWGRTPGGCPLTSTFVQWHVRVCTHTHKQMWTHTLTQTLALGFSVSHSNPVTQTDHDFTVSSVHLPPHVLREEMYSGSHTEGLRAQILKVEHDFFLYLFTFLLARTLSSGHASLHGKWADAVSPMEKNPISRITVIWTHIHTDTICTHKFASTQLLYNVTFWSYTLVC